MKKVCLLLFSLIAITKFCLANNVNPADTFPPDFGKGKTYLYVVAMPGYFQVNKALNKILEKEYTGDYEVIDVRDFTTGSKKQNVKTYSFAMIYDNQDGYFSAGGRVGPETNYSCGVKDGASGKLYRLPYEGGNYNKVIKFYIQRLEQIRKANEEAK